MRYYPDAKAVRVQMANLSGRTCLLSVMEALTALLEENIENGTTEDSDALFEEIQ